MISFDCTPAERAAVRRIACRAADVIAAHASGRPDEQSIQMDLIATHANGCPLDFAKLEGFDDVDLLHDVAGIDRHLDRNDASPTAGQLREFFTPRCAAKDND